MVVSRVSEEQIFECWVSTGGPQLAEYVSESEVGVARWLLDVLDEAGPHSEIQVVFCHRADENTNN
jgi:hypothetical protein